MAARLAYMLVVGRLSNNPAHAHALRALSFKKGIASGRRSLSSSAGGWTATVFVQKTGSDSKEKVDGRGEKERGRTCVSSKIGR